MILTTTDCNGGRQDWSASNNRNVPH